MRAAAAAAAVEEAAAAAGGAEEGEGEGEGEEAEEDDDEGGGGGVPPVSEGCSLIAIGTDMVSEGDRVVALDVRRVVRPPAIERTPSPPAIELAAIATLSKRIASTGGRSRGHRHACLRTRC